MNRRSDFHCGRRCRAGTSTSRRRLDGRKRTTERAWSDARERVRNSNKESSFCLGTHSVKRVGVSGESGGVVGVVCDEASGQRLHRSDYGAGSQKELISETNASA